MELIVLGSGSSMPAPGPRTRNPAGYAARLGGRLLLFDLGFGNLRQLARAGLDPAKVTDVFISHRHPDHVGDLAAFLFLLRYQKKPAGGRLRIWGPSGFILFWKGLTRVFRPWLTARGYKLEVRESKGGQTIQGPGWRVEALDVAHPIPALAFRLVYKGKSLVYSGDTGFCPRLPDFAAGSDLFLLECTLPSAQSAADHMNPPLALATLGASGCRRGLLTHLSEQSERELKRLLRPGGRIRLARDLMRVRL